MKKILINFYSAKSGGGKIIFDNFLQSIEYRDDLEIHIICPHNYRLENNNIIQVPVEPRMSRSFGMLWFYFVFVPGYCRKKNIDSILNFGDLIFPTIKNQTYFFDWAYLVIPDSTLWKKMDIRSKLVRKFKAKLIYLFRKNNSKILVQSEAIATAYKNELGFGGQIKVLPTPVSIHNNVGQSHEVTENDLVYISNYAPHKNFEILPAVAAELKRRNRKCRIVLTLDEASEHWISLSIELAQLGVSDMVVTVGNLKHEDVFSVLRKSKALFFPSLLESYGIPLIESILVGTPVLVSKSPFTESVCRKSVVYFDPESPVDIANEIEMLIEGSYPTLEMINERTQLLNDMLSWREYTELLISNSVD